MSEYLDSLCYLLLAAFLSGASCKIQSLRDGWVHELLPSVKLGSRWLSKVYNRIANGFWFFAVHVGLL